MISFGMARSKSSSLTPDLASMESKNDSGSAGHGGIAGTGRPRALADKRPCSLCQGGGGTEC
jgi:hypothetical protein